MQQWDARLGESRRRQVGHGLGMQFTYAIPILMVHGVFAYGYANYIGHSNRGFFPNQQCCLMVILATARVIYRTLRRLMVALASAGVTFQAIVSLHASSAVRSGLPGRCWAGALLLVKES